MSPLAHTLRMRLLAVGASGTVLATALLIAPLEGEVRQTYNVHHKLPLDDGGTNEFENLVLIRNPPEHYAITNHQKAVTHNVAVGETVVVDFPVPTTSIFPLKGNGNVSKNRVQSNKKGHKGR
ncbi:HNH endonuclease signature motif containing protein [Chitinimonas naiadis]